MHKVASVGARYQHIFDDAAMLFSARSPGQRHAGTHTARVKRQTVAGGVSWRPASRRSRARRHVRRARAATASGRAARRSLFAAPFLMVQRITTCFHANLQVVAIYDGRYRKYRYAFLERGRSPIASCRRSVKYQRARHAAGRAIYWRQSRARPPH